MTEAATSNLQFAQSKSSVLGMDSESVKYVKKNADNIYGALSMLGDLAFFGISFATSTTILSTTILAGACFVLSNLPMMFSSKEKCAVTEEKPDLNESWTHRVGKDIAKTVQPSKYPVHTSAALNMAGGGLLLAEGVMALSGGFSWSELLLAITGGIEILGRLFEIFAPSTAECCARKKDEEAKQKKQAPLQFTKSSHQVVGPKSFIGKTYEWMEEHPQMISGSLCIINSLTTIGVGLLRPQIDYAFVIGGALYLAAFAVYTMFVHSEREVEKPESTKDKTEFYTAKLQQEPKYQEATAATSSRFTDKIDAVRSATSAQPNLSLA